MSKRPLGITFFPEDRSPFLSLPPLHAGALIRLAYLSIDQPEPCSLPDDDERLAFLAGLSIADWPKVRTAIAEMMPTDGKLVRFPLFRRRYDEAAAYRRVQAANGRNGGRPSNRTESDAKPTLKPNESDAKAPFPVPDPVPVPNPEGYTNAAAREVPTLFDRDAAVREIVQAFPATNAGASPAKVRHAIYRLGGSSGEARYPTEQEAAAWLLGRVRAWAGSKLCRTTPQAYRKACGSWMDESMYDLPDSEWDRPYKGSNGQAASTATAPGKTGALDRIKAQEAALRSEGAA